MHQDLVFDLVETLEGLRRYRRWFRDESFPIRNNEMMLLMFLDRNLHDDCLGIRPSELGEILRLKRPTITSLVNSLENQGYVERISDDHDRRVVLVRLTNKGDNLMDQVQQSFIRQIRQTMEYIGEEDTRELIRIIGKVRSFLEVKAQNNDGGSW